MSDQDKIAALEAMVEALAAEVETLKTDVEGLKEAGAVAPAAKPKTPAAKPKIPEAFKVAGKSYKFRFPKFRVDIGSGPQSILAEKTTANQRKEIVEKYPGLVEEIAS